MSQIYNYPVNFNIPKVAFYGKPAVSEPVKINRRDEFISSPLIDKYLNKNAILLEAKQNQRIKELMSAYNLPVKVNENAIKTLQDSKHMQNTRLIAINTYSSLPQELKKTVNPRQLQEAAMVHDVGKTLIPNEILNKKGALNPQEREIMELHSELGYELLKNRGFDLKTLDLIKNHHQNIEGTGYPAVSAGYKHGIDAQILSAADKYSALTEKRSYKEALSREQALSIIEEDVNNGIISPEVFEALRKAV